MWPADRAGRGTLFVVVGARRIECAAWVRGAWARLGGIEQPIDAAAFPGRPAEALAAALREITLRLTGWREALAAQGDKVHELRAVVADSWLSVSGVAWSEALRQPASAERFVRGQLEAAGFAPDSDDTIRLDDAPFGQPRLAVAYPQPLLSALRQTASELGLGLGSVLPLGLAAWRAAGGHPRRDMDCIAVLHEGMMLFVHGTGRPSDVTVRSESALAAQWKRLRLRDTQLASVDRLRAFNLGPGDAAGLPSGADFEWIGLAQQDGEPAVSAALRLAERARSSAEALDPCAGRAMAAPLQWGVAATAAFVAAVLVLQAWQGDRELQAELHRSRAATAQARPAQAPVSWSREDAARIRAVNAAVRQLNLPISALLRALQPPRDMQVAVLSVDLLAGEAAGLQETSGVKIVAEARTGSAMARYVGFVSERRPFVGAYLMRHEIVETGAERPYRFTVEATWSQ